MSTQRSFTQTLVAVAWSFAGLRRKRDFDEDVGALNPFYVVAGAFLGCAAFVGILLGAVRLATA
ncbi:hypothetical protein GCM10027277_52380 [Pseudoduganella ginsengisoli]|uniref:DUF2970 domain-containing protein n=1 Tax=Pseudoduganella ginsengisoli TaxID=1462440 RepID=A0A6L6Q3M6_9BURK|nr:DUF2970 domain-containing protein [Pseudoduganella ginsengisoli]MTW04453.1 DUF2970 domain-containing protein [Pseudoduganella ginsengisoli]